MCYMIGTCDKSNLVTVQTKGQPTEAGAMSEAERLAATTDDTVMVFKVVGEFRRKTVVERVGESARNNVG